MTAILLNRTTQSAIIRSLSGILLFAAVPQEKRFMIGIRSDRFLKVTETVKFIYSFNLLKTYLNKEG
jgi:hypothetical protein